jgi:hypothetical protein
MNTVISSFANIADPDSTSQKRSIFHQMPPSSLRAPDGSSLSPDYAVLLVSDQLIVDVNSYDRLTTNRHWSYNRVADLFRALKHEGFIQIEDFSTHLEGTDSDISARVSADMATHDWNLELRESLDVWSAFINTTAKTLRGLEQHYVHWGSSDDANDLSFLMHSLKSEARREHLSLEYANRRSEEGSWVAEVLPAYLTYIHTNIELSRRLRAPIHDWSDYLPFYRRLAAGEQSRMSQAAAQAEKLFSVSFRELEPTTTAQIMRILTDKRVAALRAMIDSAVRGDIVFDRDFAVATLREALARANRMARFRSLTSYATMPLGLVPVVGTPLSKVAEEVAGATHDRIQRRSLDWFYLISEAAATPSREEWRAG